MKKKKDDTKFLKIITWILVVLIIIVGFVGIYTKKLNKLTNIVPEYTYGMDINGNREFFLKIDNTQEEKKVYIDNNGNIVGEVKNEEQQVDGYSIETRNIKSNNENNLTRDNYEKTKKIIEKRMKKLQINEYNLKLNKETGNLVIELPQNENTDNNYSMLMSEGKIEILDHQNGIVLMDNDDIVSANAVTNQSSADLYEVYLQIEFSEEGTQKLKDISNKYIEYKEEGNEESTIDYITFELDGQTLYTTYFNEEWTSNYIYIPVSNNITETVQLEETYNFVQNMANIINIGKIPVKYSLESDEFMKSTITKNNIDMFKYIVYGVLILITIVFTVRFKLKGFELGILNIGFIALYSLIIRYIRVQINLPGVISIVSILILNVIFYYVLLKNKVQAKEFNIKLVEFNISIIPFIILATVFTLTTNINTLSIGMLTFWGIIVYEIYNFLVLKTILKN